MKKYRIGKNGKLIPIGEDTVKESEQEPSRNVAIIEQGAVDCYGANEGNTRTQPSAEESRKQLREAFKKLNPDWTDAQLETAVQGR